MNKKHLYFVLGFFLIKYSKTEKVNNASRKIFNGYLAPSSGIPYSSVVFLFIESGNVPSGEEEEGYVCSGILIGPKTVLTAGE